MPSSTPSAGGLLPLPSLGRGGTRCATAVASATPQTRRTQDLSTAPPRSVDARYPWCGDKGCPHPPRHFCRRPCPRLSCGRAVGEWFMPLSRYPLRTSIAVSDIRRAVAFYEGKL